MVINYQDPLKRLYKAASQPRYFRGTVAYTNIFKYASGFLTVSIATGALMIWGISRRDDRWWQVRLRDYEEWRSRDRYRESAGPSIEELNEVSGAPSIDEQIEEAFQLDNFKFWKPRFWLEAFRPLYDPDFEWEPLPSNEDAAEGSSGEAH